MKLVPLQDRVVISPSKQQEITTGGIIIPDTAHEGGTVRGEVIAIGNGKRDEKGNLIPMEVKIGDKVLYGTSLYGTTVSIDGEEFVVMREDNILAILEN
jgi:chaperonin GroES